MMTDRPSVNYLTFDNSATYRIWVSGHLGASSSDSLQGMSIWPHPEEGRPALTVLEGELTDQAALVGVLNSLYEMHLAVLSVECLRAGQKM
jgi:hypothetical protein